MDNVEALIVEHVPAELVSWLVPPGWTTVAGRFAMLRHPRDGMIGRVVVSPIGVVSHLAGGVVRSLPGWVQRAVLADVAAAAQA